MIDFGALDQVRENIENARVRSGFDSESPVEIIAVTKTFPANAIVSAYNAGIFSIGENRVQEAVEKFAEPINTFGLLLQGLQVRFLSGAPIELTTYAVLTSTAFTALPVLLPVPIPKCAKLPFSIAA